MVLYYKTGRRVRTQWGRWEEEVKAIDEETGLNVKQDENDYTRVVTSVVNPAGFDADSVPDGVSEGIQNAELQDPIGDSSVFPENKENNSSFNEEDDLLEKIRGGAGHQETLPTSDMNENVLLSTALHYIECGDLYEAISFNGYRDCTRDQQTRRVRFLEKSPRFKESVELACERMLAKTLTKARNGEVNVSAITAAKLTYEYFCGVPPKKSLSLEEKKEEKW